MALNVGLTTITARRRGAFTWAEARTAGYTEWEIRRRIEEREWIVVRKGVYADRSAEVGSVVGADARHLLAVEGLVPASQDAAISHGSAALLHGIAHLRTVKERLHATWPAKTHLTPRVDEAIDVHCAALPAEHLTVVGGVRATVPARTVADIARGFSFDDGIVVGDSALALGLATPDEIDNVVATMSGWPGVKKARVVKSCLDARAQSPLESIARSLWLRAGFPHPELQIWMYDEHGFIGIADGGWLDPVVLYEVDGSVKYTELGETCTLLEEKRRQERVEVAGAIVRRYDWRDLWHEPVESVVRMRQAFAEAARRPPARLRLFVGSRARAAPDPTACPEAFLDPRVIGLREAYDGLR